jgi:DNA transformation protein
MDIDSGERAPMPYWSVPVDAFGDPEPLAQWVKLAFEAARRAARSI